MWGNQKTFEHKSKSNKSIKNMHSNSGSKASLKKGKDKGNKDKNNYQKKKKISEFCQEREARNQYYIKGEKQDKQKNTYRQHSCQYIATEQNQNMFEKRASLEGTHHPKINISKIKGAISFQGKYIKKSPNIPGKKSPTYKEFSSSLFNETNSHQITNRKKNKHKIKSQSKSKNKPKSKNKNSDKNIHVSILKPQYLSTERFSLNYTTNKEQFSPSRFTYDDPYEQDTTKMTPQSSRNCQRRQKINFHQFKLEVEEEKIKSTKINLLKKVPLEKRNKSIRLLSKICGAMQFRREIFSHSVNLFDSYINDQVLINKHNTLALSCLLLSLKLEQSELSSFFPIQLSLAFEKQKKCEEKQKKVRKTNEKVRHSLEKQKKKDKLQYNNTKLYDKLPILNSLLSSQKIQIDEIKQLFEYETMILLKQDFRLVRKTFSYWIDILTVLWDEHILEQLSNSSDSIEYLLFRCNGRTKNFSYLVQIVEASLTNIKFYSFNLLIIVVSAMYLLIRISMEGDSEGFNYYRLNLQKSSNILFADRVGVNMVFGELLSKIQIEIGEILPCCQFLSTYLNLQTLQEFPYQYLKYEKFDYSLSMHFFNNKIY